VTKLFTAYRILALAVGVFLLVAAINWLLSHPTTVGHDWFRLDWVHKPFMVDLWWLWMLHGYLYMAYLVVAIPFTRKAGWSLNYVLVIIIAGLIPGLMFYVEHKVSTRYKAEHPELFAAAAA